jgi:hypothetical protein
LIETVLAVSQAVRTCGSGKGRCTPTSVRWADF